ncbi:hypothetical protein [Microbacterium sp. WCS2018Hpa-9]|uniref:hypothetical protein n=1 Tax=Microbacterium sp. WCS2018Hpa-9 TaxID=3073635 RepID=UPI00288A3E09|nr:hypothetical protein [Microbacterium sp. WCS2018Hpa-9]
MLLVAAAAITGLAGDWTTVPLRARRLIRVLAAVSTVTIATMGSLAAPMIVHDPTKASATVLLWLCGWAVMLFALGISEISPLRRQMILARARRVRALALIGDSRAATPTQAGSFAVASIVGFLLPPVAWYATCVVIAIASGKTWLLHPALLLLSYAGIVSHLGWLIRADRTQSSGLRSLGVVIIVLGGSIGIIFGAALMNVPEVGIAFIMLSVAGTTALLTRGIAVHIWPYRVISAHATNRGWKAVDEQAERARRAWLRERGRTKKARTRRGVRGAMDRWLAA